MVRRVGRLTGSSAVLLGADLKRSAAYYRDMLGFQCELHGEPPVFWSPPATRRSS